MKIQDELYFYRQQATSIMGSGYSLKRLDGLHAHEERLEYLKNHKKVEYTIMFMNKTLRKHIVETDKQTKQRFEILMKQIL